MLLGTEGREGDQSRHLGKLASGVEWSPQGAQKEEGSGI